MIIKNAIGTEKIIRMMESNNTIAFEVDRKSTKDEIKKDIEKMFGVKVEKIRTHITNNRKIAYAKLDKKNSAVDLATKLGMI